MPSIYDTALGVMRAASQYGRGRVDPYTALGIVAKEGLNPNTLNSPYFGNKDVNGVSYGHWQLYSGSPRPGEVAPGGDAYEFKRRFGENPSAANMDKQNQYAIETLARMNPNQWANKWHAIRDNGGLGAINRIGHQMADRLGIRDIPGIQEARDPMGPVPSQGPVTHKNVFDGVQNPMAYTAGQGPNMGEGQNAIQQQFGNPGSVTINPGEGQDGQGGGILTDFFGLSPQASDSLGDLGDRLTGAGAAIMAIDNPAGAAALARMTSSRQKQRKGWGYKGLTPNGQGMMMEGPNGELRIDPVPEQYRGPKERQQTTAQADYEYGLEHPDFVKAQEDKWNREHPQDPAPDPDTLKMLGTSYLVSGDPSAMKNIPMKDRPEAIRLAKEEYKKTTGEDYDPADMAVRGSSYVEFMTQSRQFGRMEAATSAAHSRLKADIEVAKQAVANIPAELNSANMPWNKFIQMTSEQLQTAGYANLAKAREALYAVERGYSSVQSNGLRSGDTVYSQKRAHDLINSAMSPDALLGAMDKDGKRSGGLLDFMSQSSDRIMGGIRKGQENLRQEWKRGAKTFNGTYTPDPSIDADIDQRLGTPSAPQSTPAAPQSNPGGGGAPRISSKTDYDKLPSGAQYIDPNGQLRTKK